MKTKPLWHDRAEEPVFVEEYAKYNGEQAYIRIAFLMERPIEPGSETKYTRLETMRVYKDKKYDSDNWKLRIDEEDLVKWCYWEELVSGDVKITELEQMKQEANNDNVNHPKHYTSGFEFKQPECIDFTRHMSFCRGNAFKYVWRCGLKGDKEKAIEDLNKAKWYLTHNQYETDHTSFEELDAVFFLLQAEETHKYKALKYIVTGFFGRAIGEIDEMIKEMEAGK